MVAVPACPAPSFPGGQPFPRLRLLTGQLLLWNEMHPMHASRREILRELMPAIPALQLIHRLALAPSRRFLAEYACMRWKALPRIFPYWISFHLAEQGGFATQMPRNKSYRFRRGIIVSGLILQDDHRREVADCHSNCGPNCASHGTTDHPAERKDIHQPERNGNSSEAAYGDNRAPA